MLRNACFTTILSFSLLACGCGNDEEKIPQRGQPGGKADLTGSCVGYCSAQTPTGCWCDDVCVTYGDCCQDKKTACPNACDQAGGTCYQGAMGCPQPANLPADACPQGWTCCGAQI